jgi:hypothetical protein
MVLIVKVLEVSGILGSKGSRFPGFQKLRFQGFEVSGFYVSRF